MSIYAHMVYDQTWCSNRRGGVACLRVGHAPTQGPQRPRKFGNMCTQYEIRQPNFRSRSKLMRGSFTASSANVDTPSVCGS